VPKAPIDQSWNQSRDENILDDEKGRSPQGASRLLKARIELFCCSHDGDDDPRYGEIEISQEKTDQGIGKDDLPSGQRFCDIADQPLPSYQKDDHEPDDDPGESQRESEHGHDEAFSGEGVAGKKDPGESRDDQRRQRHSHGEENRVHKSCKITGVRQGEEIDLESRRSGRRADGQPGEGQEKKGPENSQGRGDHEEEIWIEATIHSDFLKTCNARFEAYSKSPHPPFRKGGQVLSSLLQREVGRDLKGSIHRAPIHDGLVKNKKIVIASEAKQSRHS
jgi:hypothetical protein